MATLMILTSLSLRGRVSRCCALEPTIVDRSASSLQLPSVPGHLTSLKLFKLLQLVESLPQTIGNEAKRLPSVAERFLPYPCYFVKGLQQQTAIIPNRSYPTMHRKLFRQIEAHPTRSSQDLDLWNLDRRMTLFLICSHARRLRSQS